MPLPPVTRISTLEIYNPDYQGTADLAPSDLPEFIAPQITFAQAAVLPNLQDGMIFYATDLNVYFFRQNGAWVQLNPVVAVYTDVPALVGYLPKIPSLTTDQINSIDGPVAGLIAYDSDLNVLKLRTNAAWLTVTAE